jgi:outer membrane protein
MSVALCYLRWICSIWFFLFATTQVCAQDEKHRVIGDVGVAHYKTPVITRTKDESQAVLPYVYADYGDLYARIDTFGYKLLPVGYGHLELASRLSFEGYSPDSPGIGERARPKPFGIGTFQETPYGAFIVYAFHDATSGGFLFDASYAAELSIGQLHIYPQIGIEHRDRNYVAALYGVSAAEAKGSGLSTYAPRGSNNPNANIAFEYPLMNHLKLTFLVRKRWLDSSIYESPLVNTKQQTSRIFAITQTFE